jgi:hypothetical protein
VKDFVPLLQSLIWPLFIGVMILFNRESLNKITKALTKRIEEGAALKAAGVEIGAAPSLPPVVRSEDPRQVDELPHDLYMVHVAWRDAGLDTPDHEYYRLRIFLDADVPDRIGDIVEVVYRLHPTFKEPVRRVIDRHGNFELRTIAWGEFNMTAEIMFQDGGRLVVERYINLPSPSP